MNSAVGPDFYSSMVAEDELGVVVRAHIYVEASILEFVELSVPHPSKIPRLNYEARLRLACALGLEHDHFDALKLLGDIRNQFGHNLSAEVTEAKANELFSKLPKFAQETVLASYEKSIIGHNDMPKFQVLKPKDRFVFMAVGLKMFVVSEVGRARGATDDT